MRGANGGQFGSMYPNGWGAPRNREHEKNSLASVELRISPRDTQANASRPTTDYHPGSGSQPERPFVTLKGDKYAKPLEIIREERRRFVDFASHHANPGHRAVLADLYRFWWKANRQHFEIRLIEPHITLGVTGPRVLGFCSPTTDWGSDLQITLNEKLVFGGHRVTINPWPAEGLRKFVLDVLLHEMIHQYQYEVEGNAEAGYRGHGPEFCKKCKKIGEKLGLPPVIVRRRGQKDADKPVCCHWPHNVRPSGFYIPDVDEGRILKAWIKPRPEPEWLQIFRNLLAIHDDHGPEALRRLLEHEIERMTGTAVGRDEISSLLDGPSKDIEQCYLQTAPEIGGTIDMDKHSNMYDEAKTWNPFKGCGFACIYCGPTFQKQSKRQKQLCKKCYKYTPHYHSNRLRTIPSKPIIFVCGNSDISFCRPDFIRQIIERIKEHNKRCPQKTYYFQSKKPACFEPFQADLPDNVILLTTLETNRDGGYAAISKAPPPSVRYEQFRALKYPRKVITIEPVIEFDLRTFVSWIRSIRPEYVWLGFNSQPDAVTLPEPPEAKVQKLADRLLDAGIEVRGKTLRGVALGPTG